MKKKFVVETINTFYEAHLVEAENEEEARLIASNSDYNASKWLGQQFVAVEKYSKQDLERLKARDDYFFEGYSTIDDDGDEIDVCFFPTDIQRIWFRVKEEKLRIENEEPKEIN